MAKYSSLVLSAVFASFLVTPAAAAEKVKKGSEKKPSAEAAFKQMDKDKDGKLTKGEFTDGRKEPILAADHFDAADKDKDTFLTLSEFRAGGDKMIAKPRGKAKKANQPVAKAKAKPKKKKK